jgi:hypothetical protein
MPGFENATGVLQEYDQTVQSFPQKLPPGIQYPSQPPSSVLQPDVQAQDGVGASFVAFYWLCAWEANYLHAFSSNDEKQEHTALASLSKWPTIPFYQEHIVDPTNAWEANVLDPAKLGDPSGVKEDFTSCGAYKEYN